LKDSPKPVVSIAKRWFERCEQGAIVYRRGCGLVEDQDRCLPAVDDMAVDLPGRRVDVRLANATRPAG
jgi:hypothetical protein